MSVNIINILYLRQYANKKSENCSFLTSENDNVLYYFDISIHVRMV